MKWLVITCTYDPLRDEGRTYADKLRAAGVPVLYKNYVNVHGFLARLGSFTGLTPG